uniref:IlGF domain-containing protein n=1 Tax=Onchocerca volvulus TaxID=6282 RepID=A0A2K6WMR6_ONCVO
MDFGDLNNKSLKMRSSFVPDQSDNQRSGNISKEQIQEVLQEVIADNKSFDISRVSLSFGDRNIIHEVIKRIIKRSSIRICGSRLIAAVIELCNGCVQPIGSKRVERSLAIPGALKGFIKTLVDKCCIHGCSIDDMRIFCCQ